MHGGVVSPDAGAPTGNANAKKHGVYAKIIHKNLPESDAELFDSINPDSELDEDIRLCTYKIAKLEQWIADNRDADGFEYPTDAYKDLTDLKRKLLKDKKELVKQ